MNEPVHTGPWRHLALVVEQESMVVVYRYNLFPQDIPSSLVTEVDHSLRTIAFEGRVPDNFQEVCDQFRIKIVPPSFKMDILETTPESTIPFSLLSVKSYWMHRVEKSVSYKRSSYISSIYGNEVYRELLNSAFMYTTENSDRALSTFKKRYNLKTDHEALDLIRLKNKEIENVVITTEEMLTEALLKLRSLETVDEVREYGKLMSTNYRLAF